jgi:hypothetical protein
LFFISLPFIRHCEGVLPEAIPGFTEFSPTRGDCFATRRALAARNDEVLENMNGSEFFIHRVEEHGEFRQLLSLV